MYSKTFISRQKNLTNIQGRYQFSDICRYLSLFTSTVRILRRDLGPRASRIQSTCAFTLGRLYRRGKKKEEERKSPRFFSRSAYFLQRIFFSDAAVYSTSKQKKNKIRLHDRQGLNNSWTGKSWWVCPPHVR